MKSVDQQVTVDTDACTNCVVSHPPHLSLHMYGLSQLPLDKHCSGRAEPPPPFHSLSLSTHMYGLSQLPHDKHSWEPKQTSQAPSPPLHLREACASCPLSPMISSEYETRLLSICDALASTALVTTSCDKRRGGERVR